MRLRLEYRLEGDAEPRRVDLLPVDIVAWEDTTGQKMSALAGGIGMRDMLVLLHAYRSRWGDRESFEDFAARVVEVTPVPPDEAPADGAGGA